MTRRITPSQIKQLSRIAEDAIEELVISKIEAQSVIEQGGVMQEHLTHLLLQIGSGDTPSQAAARAIMGTNFYGLPEVVRHFGQVTIEQRVVLSRVPFSEQILRDCADSHVLFLDMGQSIVSMAYQFSNFMGHIWESGRLARYGFATNTAAPTWRLIRKTTIPRSVNVAVHRQGEVLREHDMIPGPREVFCLCLLHRLEGHGRLMNHRYALCYSGSDRSAFKISDRETHRSNGIHLLRVNVHAGHDDAGVAPTVKPDDFHPE